jgi:hypothetical protein
MTKLHRLHNRYSQSPWLNTPATTSPATIRYGIGPKTDVFPGQHDRREK